MLPPTPAIARAAPATASGGTGRPSTITWCGRPAGDGAGVGRWPARRRTARRRPRRPRGQPPRSRSAPRRGAALAGRRRRRRRAPAARGRRPARRRAPRRRRAVGERQREQPRRDAGPVGPGDGQHAPGGGPRGVGGGGGVQRHAAIVPHRLAGRVAPRTRTPRRPEADGASPAAVTRRQVGSGSFGPCRAPVPGEQLAAAYGSCRLPACASSCSRSTRCG